jgi:uncharacterized membrane protein (GlpM family)
MRAGSSNELEDPARALPFAMVGLIPLAGTFAITAALVGAVFTARF